MPVIGESIVFKSTSPNFDRDSVKSLQNLKEVNTRQYDIGHIVYCEEDGIHYKFMGKSVELDETTGYFRQLIPTSFDNEELESQVEELETQVDENTKKLNRLYEKEFPIKATIEAYEGDKKAQSLYLKGSLINLTLKFSLTQDETKVNISEIEKIILKCGTKTHELVNYTAEYNIGTIITDTSYRVSYYLKNGSIKEASGIIKFSPYSYFGVVDENGDIENVDVSKLNSILLSSRSYTTMVTQNNQKNCFIYPEKYGALTSIKDSKNYELLGSYVNGVKTINGESYRVYLLEHASTVENYKLIFS